MRRALAALLLLASPAGAEDPDQSARLLASLPLIATLRDGDALLAACPAAVFPKWLAPSSTASTASCSSDPQACARACIQRGDADSCFFLAHVFEESEIPALALPARRLHAAACALGQPAGCTNRGGGMRNVPLDGDPWWAEDAAGADPARKERCLYDSFQLACDKGDGWGCAMLGQALAEGEGIKPDASAARRARDKACRLGGGPDSAACHFAREGAAELPSDPPGAPP